MECICVNFNELWVVAIVLCQKILNNRTDLFYMKKAHIYLLFILLIAPNRIVPQNSDIEILLDSAFRARLRMDNEGNQRYLTKAEKVLRENTPIVDKTKVYAELSRYHLVNGDFDQARIYAEKASDINKKPQDKISEAYGYYAWATYYNFLDIGDLAVENVQNALRALDTNDDKALRARLYYMLYGVYSSWDDEERSVHYADKTIRTAEEINDYEVLANAFSGKATAMEYLYRKTGNQTYVDSILYYLKDSKKLFEKYPNRVGVRTYSITNLNIASFFYKYDNVTKQQTQDSVLHYTNIAMEVAGEFDKSHEIRSNINGLLSEIAIQQNDYTKAEQLLLEAYNHLKTAASPSFYALSNISNGLSNLYERIGKHEQALFFLKEKQQADYVFFNQAQALQATKLEAQYENNRLTESIKLVEQKAQSQRMLNLLMIGITLLLLVILGLGYAFFKNKTKYEREEQVRLKTERELLVYQKKQMQKEAMTTALQIERKDKLLAEMQNILKELNAFPHSNKYDRALRDEKRIDEALEKNLKEFQDINPAFFDKLNERAVTRLTPLDLKYCAYILLKLSNKEIAHIFNVAPGSVRVTKYRIKQKLNLKRHADLNEFLQNL